MTPRERAIEIVAAMTLREVREPDLMLLNLPTSPNHWLHLVDRCERAIAAAVADEREACAREADIVAERDRATLGYYVARDVAARIRARTTAAPTGGAEAGTVRCPDCDREGCDAPADLDGAGPEQFKAWLRCMDIRDARRKAATP